MTPVRHSLAGIRLFAGSLAGGDLFAAPGPFSLFDRARADATTHDDTRRALKIAEADA